MILIFLSKYSYRKLLIHSSSKSLQNILKMISSHEQKSRNDWYTTCWLIKKVKEDFFFFQVKFAEWTKNEKNSARKIEFQNTLPL